MEAWNHLLNQALLGAEKAPDAQAFPDTTPAQAKALEAITQKEMTSEARLLETAALLYACRRAGVKPLAQTATLAPSEPETQPYCSAEAAQVLKEILDTKSIGLITSWLEHCRKRGQIALPERLEELIELALREAKFQESVIATMGKRGAWLCRLHPDWKTLLSGTADEDAWETGNTKERAAFIGALHTTDPDRARQLLQDTWPKEKADAREYFLLALMDTIGPEDLPFLEKVAADKSKKVKSLAHNIMLRIPESRIVKEIEAILANSVSLKTESKMPGLVKNESLYIAVPEKPEGELGEILHSLPEYPKMISEPGGILAIMMRYVPPSFWEKHLQLPPEKILAFFEAQGKKKKYADALFQATIHFKSKEWAPVLAEHPQQYNNGILELLDGPAEAAYLKKMLELAPKSVINNIKERKKPIPESLALAISSAIASYDYPYGDHIFSDAIHLLALSGPEEVQKLHFNEKVLQNPYSRENTRERWPDVMKRLTRLVDLKQRTEKAFA